MRTALLWVIMQRVVGIYYQWFKTTYWSHHKSKRQDGPIGCPKRLVRNYHYILHSNTEQCSCQLLLKSQLTPHKEQTLSGSLKHFKQSQFISHKLYYNDNNPDITSPVTIATCLIPSCGECWRVWLWVMRLCWFIHYMYKEILRWYTWRSSLSLLVWT
jgi:hypothetical protein